MGVSENSGKIINHPFWGTSIFGNTHILGLMNAITNEIILEATEGDWISKTLNNKCIWGSKPPSHQKWKGPPLSRPWTCSWTCPFLLAELTVWNGEDHMIFFDTNCLKHPLRDETHKKMDISTETSILILLWFYIIHCPSLLPTSSQAESQTSCPPPKCPASTYHSQWTWVQIAYTIPEQKKHVYKASHTFLVSW